MYGLEMTVMMALQGDCVIHTEKPFFPDDIVETINALPGTTVLVTTPAHLRVLLASGLQLPHVARIVSATAPLSRAIACDAELKMQTTLEELYGCTEAGATATRRTTQDDDWHLLEGMRFFQTMTNGGDETQVHGDHLPEAACLQDILKLESETRFKLVGRSGDMINVGGKRASLANLNQLLLAIDGIEDGVVYFSASGERDGALRPAAFVVTSLPEQEVLKAMAKSMDPVFLPRPLIKVEKIPRNETGKIIREQLLAMQKN
jgi:acyl-coenzyme A synthetase/AMP-(fatty) acid ligase